MHKRLVLITFFFFLVHERKKKVVNLLNTTSTNSCWVFFFPNFCYLVTPSCVHLSVSLSVFLSFSPPPVSFLFTVHRCLLHRSTQLMHLCSSMHLSLQHLYLRNCILHWFFFFVCKDSLSLDGLSPSRSPWWRWGCVAHLQFGSTSNCSAVLRVHVIYNQHLFGHCVILILCHSRNLLENQSMQSTFERDNLELFFPFFCLLLWMNATKSLSWG